MKKNTEALLPETFYHIYNRGINGEQIFKKEKNYAYFLQQYAKYIEPIATTYAYVLMGNHFHFLIKTKTETESRANVKKTQKTPFVVGDKPEKTIEFINSNQFAKCFNSYVQSINIQEKRTGSLFEDQFRRIPLEYNDYILYMFYYIHFNPQKHGFVTDFRTYSHSSYQSFLSNAPTRLPREEVFLWFGGKEGFIKYHEESHNFEEKWGDTDWIE
ncbi:MAG: hypothetical protein RLZZ292_133 [Bacteroidota bacterium]|jgi:hypothetical protein